MKRTFLLTVEITEQACDGGLAEMNYWTTFLQEHIQHTFKDRYPHSILHTAEVTLHDPRRPFELLDEGEQARLVDFCAEGIRDTANQMPEELTRTVLMGYDQEEIDEEFTATKEIDDGRAEEETKAEANDPEFRHYHPGGSDE